ncbi:MAG: amidohydrolase family protein [Pirellula sp.]
MCFSFGFLNPSTILVSLSLGTVLFSTTFALGQVSLDVILTGGRVMDPETGLDAIRDVGISGQSIVAISQQSLAPMLRPEGSRIDASGLVVAPGFIDLHAHGQSDDAFRYRVHDGVTTALELEWGYPRLVEWMGSRAGASRIHYGASASHGILRVLAMLDSEPGRQNRIDQINTAVAAAEPLNAFDELPFIKANRNNSLSENATDLMMHLLDEELRHGGLGIGMAHQYYPGASRREILRVFQFAATKRVPIFVHVRESGLGGMQEVIANAAATGAPLHIVHINSMSGNELPEVLQLVGNARDRGLDITAETYPYTAASTRIESSFFDDGWQQRLGISYNDLQWQDSGERLTAETFKIFRERKGVVIIHMMREDLIELAVKTPFVMIASDAMPYASGAHPRSAGTFAKVLGHYVRERGSLDLMTALRKMTIMPAQRLESIAPTMKKKGRLQIGADADLVVFDSRTIIDTATYLGGLSYSKGIQHVLVSGTVVVGDGKLIEGKFPGKLVTGRLPEIKIEK